MRQLITFILLIACTAVSAQTVPAAVTSIIATPDTLPAIKDPYRCLPPLNRQLFHDYINKQQELVLNSDGTKDSLYILSEKEEANKLLTQSVVDRVDLFQCAIENDSTLSHQNKIRYLRGMENLLKFFTQNRRAGKLTGFLWPDIIAAFEKCVQEDKNGRSIAPVINELPYLPALSVVKADRVTFENNAGFRASQELVLLKFCLVYPKQTLPVLNENPDLPFADSLIRIVAKKFPAQLYDYAAADNKLGAIIRNIKDDVFISTVSQMAVSSNGETRSGQQYFPFLDNIVKGKMSFADIDSVKGDSLLYYRLLVKTQKDYFQRAINKDTAFEFTSLTRRLEDKARSVFVTTINELHNEKPEVRFRCLQSLTAEELYYIAVSSDGVIYTSSFVKGVYPLMMKKINNRGDSLLMTVSFDKYRRLIKMAAGYNTLGNFLGSFPSENDANALMKAFVKNLEKGGLEDGVDVADSYASIAETLKPVASEMLKNIEDNYQRNVSQNNKKGIAIYNILHKLFLSADSSNKIDLVKELSIPPVYTVPVSSLSNDSGRVIMQVFFYGDEDGRGVFPGFLNLFSNNNWKIDRSNEQWVTISSAKGKPVIIYANRPLPEEGGQDEEAQKALCVYLDQNKLYPSVTIHRGHSYYAESTIHQMFSSSKIVFLGSCGGYHLIHEVLEKIPDAHIISTKQIADYPVNNPFFQLLTDKIRNGHDIDWIPFWKELDRMVTAKIFEDYIPPYKNLGALFIKAYKIAMEE